ncbi:MAG: hypothetical protein JWM21_2733 [Acidobacteria bacterium]|nr:hypothetical protein [Acidobacteriota bacterium]
MFIATSARSKIIGPLRAKPGGGSKSGCVPTESLGEPITQAGMKDSEMRLSRRYGSL